MNEKSPFAIEKEGHIAWLILNRPEKRNAMNRAFFEGLLDIFPKLEEDPEVRVIIIKAEGKSFTAGLDLFEFFIPSGGDSDDSLKSSPETNKKFILEAQESFNIIEKCRKPVIAAAHSHCIGGGVDLLCACDIRLASKDTVFAIRETKIAIVADLGTLQRIPKIIGEGWTRELALTGRNFSADEALKMGFITRMLDDTENLYAEAKRIAEEIASNAPGTVQSTKDVLNFTRDNGIYAGLEYVALKNSTLALLPNEDLKEAMSAFMEKRDPVFKG